LGSRKGRGRQNAEQGNIGHQIAEQLQSFRRQLGSGRTAWHGRLLQAMNVSRDVSSFSTTQVHIGHF